jgi:hypothetical protein
MACFSCHIVLEGLKRDNAAPCEKSLSASASEKSVLLDQLALCLVGGVFIWHMCLTLCSGWPGATCQRSLVIVPSTFSRILPPPWGPPPPLTCAPPTLTSSNPATYISHNEPNSSKVTRSRETRAIVGAYINQSLNPTQQPMF